MRDLFASKYGWRHFAHTTADSTGPSTAPPAFPYGPVDPQPGWGAPPPPPPPPKATYPTGPAKQQSYYNAPPKAAPPPDPWAGISAAAHDAAVGLVSQFGGVLGWPAGFDANKWALAMVKAGVNPASPLDAYEYLFWFAIDGNQRDANPWARYGMFKDDYNTVASKLNSVFFDWTGDQMNSEVLTRAIRGNWTPDQIRNVAIYNNPSGGTTPRDEATFLGDMPWLTTGQSYTQTLQQFQAFEEHAPADKQTLAAYFRFGQGAKQINSSRDPAGQAVKLPQIAEVR